jgi:hypothetical protein
MFDSRQASGHNSLEWRLSLSDKAVLLAVSHTNQI